ncbi:MAG: histidine--tRNA ligase [Gammaproteobacteria bacterium]
MQSIQAVRGMKDTLPSETFTWREVESKLVHKITQCGYREIRLPIVEKTDLFHRSIGEVTDIVAKEMYTFLDRNGDSLSLRPEGTACCVRAALENGLIHNQTQRLWYMGPMFRHERPQKGRYRQFYQIGVEAFGWQGPDLDIEQLLLSHSFWKALGLEQSIRLEINTLGTLLERQQHRVELIHYFKQNESKLNKEARERLETNPLRILDSKDPEMQDLVNNAPKLIEYLDSTSLKFFETIQASLKEAGVDFKVNPRLVRGLDYYSHTVFEWITDELGAQGTVCGGGRFDGLVELIGGKSIPAVGFAVGLDRVVDVYMAHRAQTTPSVDVYIVAVGEEAERKALLLAHKARESDKVVICNAGGGNFKKQFERANKSGAKVAYILGESEIQQNFFGIKDLRGNEPELKIRLDLFLKEGESQPLNL